MGLRDSASQPESASDTCHSVVMRLAVLFALAVGAWTGAAVRTPWERALELQPDPGSRDLDDRDYFVGEHAGDPFEAALMAGWRLEEPMPIRNWWLFSVPKGENWRNHKLSKREAPSILLSSPWSSVQKRAPVTDKGDGTCLSSSKKREGDPVKSARVEFNITDPLFGAQWHILNPDQHGHDMNVLPVWRRGITGKNVTVAIVDDGLDYDHPDFTESFSKAGSWDYNAHRNLPTPELDDDTHGTRCAGEISADMNYVCGVGIAPGAKVAGIRILSGRLLRADEARALIHRYQVNDIYSCSWGPSDDGLTIEGPPPIVRRAEVAGIEEGRGGRGSIYVVASGNGAFHGDNCNYDGYTNSIYSITVGAVDRNNQHPYYAESCSANMVVTYSSNTVDKIVTSDKRYTPRGPDGQPIGEENMCTEHHTGTSAAAPIAAAVFALVLEQRPDLTWRDLQYLVRESAKTFKIPPGGPATWANGDYGADWQITADGKRYHNAYGYGMLDADAITSMAVDWKLVGPQAWFIGPKHETEIPIVGADPVKSTIKVSQEEWDGANLRRLEHIKVRVDFEHQHRGDLRFLIESPAGVVSELAAPRPNDRSSLRVQDWDFMSVVHWGEVGVGDWKLAIVGAHGTNGTLHSWQLKLYGEAEDASQAKRYSDEWNLYELPAEYVQDAIDEAAQSVSPSATPEPLPVPITSDFPSSEPTSTTTPEKPAEPAPSFSSPSASPAKGPTENRPQEDSDGHSILFYLVMSSLGVSIIVILAAPAVWSFARRQKRRANRMDLGDFDLVPSDIELSDLDSDAHEVYLDDDEPSQAQPQSHQRSSRQSRSTLENEEREHLLESEGS